MALTSTTQGIVDWSRTYIPDPKTRTKAVRKEVIGQTALATGSRETFYVKQSPTASVFLYVEPYKFSPSSTLNSLSSTDKKFMWQTATLACIFPDGSSDSSTRPAQYKSVLADYEYAESLPYMYSDDELAVFLPPAISYLNNAYNFSYAYTGSGDSLTVTYSTNDDKELLSRALALLARKSFVEEQMHRGLGVKFRGPMQSIDSTAQMKEYVKATQALEKAVEEQAAADSVTGGAQIVDVYTETVVDA